MKQEYPEMLEDDSFTSADEARLVTCPHSIEEQTELILEKIKAALDAHDTGFENVFNTDFFVTDRALWPAALRTMKKWMDRECLGHRGGEASVVGRVVVHVRGVVALLVEGERTGSRAAGDAL